MTHIGKVPYKPEFPPKLRAWATYMLLPAAEQMSLRGGGVVPPVVWATRKASGTRVRLVMASRLGDVGVNYSGADHGYALRVDIGELDKFSGAEHDPPWEW